MELQERRKLIGVCGNYCGKCNDYIAYVTKDKELQKKVADEIAEQLNINITPEQVGCLGCRGSIHNTWAASIECKIRQCVEKKKILCCGLCDKFPCEIFTNQFDGNSQPRRNIDRIREIGIDSWLDGLEEH
jgi:hypothetical protein